jgi:hypothetical protein
MDAAILRHIAYISGVTNCIVSKIAIPEISHPPGEFTNKKIFLFQIISFSIGFNLVCGTNRRPLFLLILTHYIPYGIRGEENHSTTPKGPP